MAEEMTGGAAMAEATLARGVDTVFALPGVQTYPLMDALQRAGNRVRVVGVRHEQAAAYMAMGYAKATGKPGVFSVVPGPGVLNASAALLTAATTCAPVMLLTGQAPSPFVGRGRGHLHEMPDQLATLRSYIKWAGRADTPGDAPALVAEAWKEMITGKPGPVSVEMCWDRMAWREDMSIPDPAAPPAPTAPDPTAITEAVAMIRAAKRPMIMCGAGAQHASAEVAALAEAIGAPVTALRSGRGVVADDHPLFVRSAAAWELWEDTDLLIGIGSRCEMQTMRWTGMMKCADRLDPPRKLIRIEIDPEEMKRLIPDVGLLTDSALGAAAIADALAGHQPDAEAPARIAAARKTARAKYESVQPHVGYLDVIREVLPRDGILVKDICQAGFTSYFAWPVYEPRTYITSGYQGNLGFAYPTALGAKVGRPDRAVVAILGDGGFMFAAQEMSTAAQHGIGVIAIVFNNGSYGNVRRDQQNLFHGREIASSLTGVDYVKLAESQGVAAARVTSAAELKPVLKKAVAADAPMLIEVIVDPTEEVSPWPHIIPAGRPAEQNRPDD